MNTTNSALKVHEFFVSCGKCGVYRIGEKTAIRFLTKALQHKLREAFRKNARAATLKFLKGCPNCKPNNTDAEVELSVTYDRSH